MNKKGFIGLLIIISMILPVASVAAALDSSPSSQSGKYSMEQALSDKAQLSTIAFSGLAFITGNAGADGFFPPGKVADFFGFQYMRDVDVAGYGHNTQFLSRVANNVLYILNDDQKAQLVALAKDQAPLYVSFAYNRLPILNTFRRNLEGDVPSGSNGLDSDVVSNYTSNLYKMDAELSYNRAITVGLIISSFTDDQKDYLAKMKFDDFNTWPDVKEDDTLKKSLTNTEFVAVMTYASELFSWYKGNVEADAYFCPERHGTYFGGFFMKDYPAMNNPDYFISTAVTGDKGQAFLDILNRDQRALIEGIIPEQKDAMNEIAQIRTEVSTELRKAQSGGTVDKDKVFSLIERYGALDGQVSALYATRFAQLNSTLTSDQRAALVKLRDLDISVNGTYMFSTLTSTTEIPDTDFMFGTETMPSNAGYFTPPSGFVDEQKQVTNATKAADKTADKIKVIINGKEISFDVPPKNQNGRTLVPVRAIVEALGAKVSWIQSSNTVVVSKGSTIIIMPVGSNIAQVNGIAVSMDSPAQIINNRTLVPLRFLAEYMGYKVNWDAVSKTITIRS